MKRFSVALTAVAVVLAATVPGLAEESKNRAKDKKAIEKLAASYMEAFNKGDSKAIAGFLAPDADYVGPKGKLVKGRENLEKRYAAFFAANPNVKLKTRVTGMKFVTDNVAVLDTAPEVDPPLQGPPVETRATIVVVKRDGRWFVETARDSLHFVPSNYQHLKRLEWMIGDWRDDGADPEAVSVESSCKWTVNKNFIIRKFTVRLKDRIESGGTQVIGWDPRAHTVRSWVFDSDGEFAHADWQPDGNRWIVQSIGVLRDGGEVSSTNIVTKVDHNTFTFQSTNRVIDGRGEADIPPVTIKRLAPEGAETAEPKRETILPD